jgi:hypothetical protein
MQLYLIPDAARIMHAALLEPDAQIATVAVESTTQP